MRSHYLEYIMIILLYVQYDHPYIVRSILIELSGGNLGQVADHAREHPLAQLPPRRTHARMGLRSIACTQHSSSGKAS
jgi:hypothetical protein